MRPSFLLVLLGLFVCFAPLFAQDLHNSQFYLNPSHLSPASTGVFQGKVRVAGVYRSQWRSVPVAYRTYSLAADWKAIEREKQFTSDASHETALIQARQFADFLIGGLLTVRS